MKNLQNYLLPYLLCRTVVEKVGLTIALCRHLKIYNTKHQNNFQIPMLIKYCFI